MASLIRSVRITAATILSLSMVSKGSNENPTFFWSHLVDAIEIQISFGVWSHLWQPGQSSMGVSMTCSWSTGALWHWVTHKNTNFDHTIPFMIDEPLTSISGINSYHIALIKDERDHCICRRVAFPQFKLWRSCSQCCRCGKVKPIFICQYLQ